MKRIFLWILTIILCFGFCFAASAQELDLKTVIEPQAFAGNTALTSAVIPEGVTAIGEAAFAGCTSLKSIYLPLSLTAVGSGAFETGCADTVVYVIRNSPAHSWCRENGVLYSFYGENANPVTYRALLVGNTYPGEDAELEGPDNDIAGMKTMLSLQTGTPYLISTRLNATASSIRLAISTVFAGADSNDVSLFYFSGHGINSYSSSLLGALCGTNDTYVTFAELRTWLDTVPGRKIVLLDSCHSGSHINKSAGSGFDPEKFNEAVIAAFSAKTRDNLAADDYYVITSSSKTQRSVSFGYSGDNNYVGLFTYAVAMGSGYDMLGRENCGWNADEDADGDITIGETCRYVTQIVQEYGYTQKAQYHGPETAVLWSR